MVPQVSSSALSSS
uniref:Uncharacterized protein n=1 Tax=Rhizophora mucronata TaxID=61149 RepID=A0A2P2NBW8_RHIMU